MRELIIKIADKVRSHIRRIKAILNLDTEYKLDDFSIVLPADHALPTYQTKHRRYDRFLPFLSKYIKSGSTVIDVGANCGDTVAAMFAANKTLSYICIEANSYFFSYLERNANRMKAKSNSTSIKLINSFVGKDITNVTLEGSVGTKKAILGGGGHRSKTLDSLVLDEEPTSIRLLKSDVDGFDYDIINSAQIILTKHSPILFFECQLDHEFQKFGYTSMLTELVSQGYENFFIFDNFGELLFTTKNISDVNQLIEYVWRQNALRATRTIYYYDIISSKNNDADLINNAVSAYIKNV